MRNAIFPLALVLASSPLFSCAPESNSNSDGGTPPPTVNQLSECPASEGLTEIVQNGRTIVCVNGTLTENVSMTAGKAYLLTGPVFVGKDGEADVTLSIEPGVTVYGEEGSFLSISRGSKIMAEGAEDAPIVFTSAKPEGERQRRDWGGLVVNGRARNNRCFNAEANQYTADCNIEGEAGTGLHGGDDDGDSSGVLKYVRVEFGGFPIDDENELNGIAFQSVGRGTKVEYIQVHMNGDDGVEFYGGTVDVKYVLLTGNSDDSMDWVNGWTGRAQFVLIKQYDDAANNGIEADNFSKAPNAQPRSNPTISNLTIFGTTQAQKAANGILLRQGTAATLVNSVVTNTKKEAFDIDTKATFDNALKQDGIVLENVVLSQPEGLFINDGEQEKDKETGTVVYEDAFSITDMIFSAVTSNTTVAAQDLGAEAVMALDATTFVNMDASFFVDTDFVGAGDAWTANWSDEPAN